MNRPKRLLRVCDTTVSNVRFVSEFAGSVVCTVVLQILSYFVLAAKRTDVGKQDNVSTSDLLRQLYVVVWKAVNMEAT